MSNSSRRGFLASTLSAAALAAMPAGASAIGPIARRGTPRMRLGLAAYSMRQFLQAKPGTAGAMDLLGFIDWAATLDTDAVELTSYFFPETITRDYLNEIKRRCHVNGLDISGGRHPQQLHAAAPAPSSRSGSRTSTRGSITTPRSARRSSACSPVYRPRACRKKRASATPSAT